VKASTPIVHISGYGTPADCPESLDEDMGSVQRLSVFLSAAIRLPLRAFRGAVVCLLILIGLPSVFAATLTGRVVDAHTGESIANAEVSTRGSQLKVRTDENGGFTVTDLPVGDVQLLVTCVGYARLTRTVHLDSGATAPMVIALFPEASTPTQTVTVTAPAFDTLDVTNPSSEETLSKQEIQALSMVLLGDPMRAAQALPGVTSNNDWDSQFSVRGAGPENVGVYIDGVATHDFFDAFAFSTSGASGTANLSLPIVNADMVSSMCERYLNPMVCSVCSAGFCRVAMRAS